MDKEGEWKISREMSPAEVVAEHIAECTDAQAAIVVDGNADEIVQRLQEAGWGISERVDIVAGKRIRFMTLPVKEDPEENQGDESDSLPDPDPCPECGARIIEKWSGVKCSKCDWWFCY